MACPVSPSLKDLPKVAIDLKSQLEGFNHQCLKDVDTNEKNVLPSAQGGFSYLCFVFGLPVIKKVSYFSIFLTAINRFFYFLKHAA